MWTFSNLCEHVYRMHAHVNISLNKVHIFLNFKQLKASHIIYTKGPHLETVYAHKKVHILEFHAYKGSHFFNFIHENGPQLELRAQKVPHSEFAHTNF